jgi:hypothetical protein
MLRLLDRAAQLTDLKGETPRPEPLTREAALKTTALAATLLFARGQTTERTVVAAERLGLALGVTARVLPPPRPHEPGADVRLTSEPAPLRVPNGEIYLHQFLPILAHIIPPHLLHAGRLESLPRN